MKIILKIGMWFLGLGLLIFVLLQDPAIPDMTGVDQPIIYNRTTVPFCLASTECGRLVPKKQTFVHSI